VQFYERILGHTPTPTPTPTPTLNGVDVLSGSQRTRDDDPTPYYDDSRSVQFVAKGDVRVTLALTSGRHNYYGGCMISVGGSVVYNETWESFDAETECQGGDGVVYVVKLNFV
jgi:hypothetical protein